MISSFRNFAKTKFAGILVFIIIIPFVFWGMGGMFSGGNTNNLAKIDKINISTQDFMNHLNNSGIPEQTIRKNLDNNIIEEILTTLISTTLLDMEIKDFNIIFSENSLLKKIKKNKNFLNENGNFERIKYEKFLLENNLSLIYLYFRQQIYLNHFLKYFFHFCKNYLNLKIQFLVFYFLLQLIFLPETQELLFQHQYNQIIFL